MLDTLPTNKSHTSTHLYPLSNLQREIYLNYLIHKDSSINNIGACFRITGPFHREHFITAIDDLVEKYDVFRCRLVENGDEIYCRYLTQIQIPMNVIDYSGKDLSNDLCDEYIHSFEQNSFNLLTDLPYQFALIKLSDNCHVFACVFHHMFFDGKSLEFFFSFLSSQYNKRLQKPHSLLMA